MNPFRFGSIVEEGYFTDRSDELEEIKHKLDSENHIVLISPRRFGKSSLVNRAIKQIGRPSITIDMMKVLSVEDFSSQIVKAVFSIFPLAKVKNLISQFKIIPKMSYNPLSDSWDISFLQPDGSSYSTLEDAIELLSKVTHKSKRLIVVLDEFQEITDINENLPKQLRALIQKQSGLNYIFMGSQESMMNDIFEKKKSPFYHFGQRMNLRKIPYDDFFSFIINRLPDVPDNSCTKESIAEDILSFSGTHPYYTQQLSSDVYDNMTYGHVYDGVVEKSIMSLVQQHDLDYERLWLTMNRTFRKILRRLALGQNPMSDRTTATSTTYSALKKLVKLGYVNKTDKYELEDPFFGRWIKGEGK